MASWSRAFFTKQTRLAPTLKTKEPREERKKTTTTTTKVNKKRKAAGAAKRRARFSPGSLPRHQHQPSNVRQSRSRLNCGKASHRTNRVKTSKFDYAENNRPSIGKVFFYSFLLSFKK